MAFVPIIVSNKRRNCYRSRSGSGVVVMVLGLVIFGLLIFFMFGMSNSNRIGFRIVPLFSGFIIFFLIIIGISVISISAIYKKPKEESMKSYSSQYKNLYQSQKQKPIHNPYIIHKNLENELEELKEVKKNFLSVSGINYCRFCGAKIDRDAVFCHQCGINISS